MEERGLDVEARCHAGHAAGCHHGTFPFVLRSSSTLLLLYPAVRTHGAVTLLQSGCTDLVLFWGFFFVVVVVGFFLGGGSAL